MGLTKNQWLEKRISELEDYVKEHGYKVKDVIYWDTYPIIVKDVCVLGVAIFNDELVFCDYNYRDCKFKIIKEAKSVERKYLEEVIKDMKQLDKNKK